jgi:ribose/xylose/arabinose/galactoside ABC-type transport system permease subunit
LVTAVIVTRVFGVPLGFYYALILCAVIWYVLSYTALGRRMLFVGRGREVAQAVIVILALGLVVPLTCNDYDLSIASNLTLAGTVLALVNVRLGVPIAWSILAALAVGALVGFVNGFFVIYFRINSLIVTLGVGTFIHGITWERRPPPIQALD